MPTSRPQGAVDVGFVCWREDGALKRTMQRVTLHQTVMLASPHSHSFLPLTSHHYQGSRTRDRDGAQPRVATTAPPPLTVHDTSTRPSWNSVLSMPTLPHTRLCSPLHRPWDGHCNAVTSRDSHSRVPPQRHHRRRCTTHARDHQGAAKYRRPRSPTRASASRCIRPLTHCDACVTVSHTPSESEHGTRTAHGAH